MLWIIVVSGPVEVGGHHGNEIATVLAAVRLTELNAGDLRHYTFVGSSRPVNSISSVARDKNALTFKVKYRRHGRHHDGIE
jgi:hypothetical protein